MGIANPPLYIRNKVLRYVLGSLSFDNFSVETKTEHNIMTCRVRDRNTNGLISIVYILNTLSHPCCPPFCCCLLSDEMERKFAKKLERRSANRSPVSIGRIES